MSIKCCYNEHDTCYFRGNSSGRWTREQIQSRMKEQQQQSSGVGGEGGTASDTTDADKLNVNRIACPELDEIYATHQVISCKNIAGSTKNIADVVL